MTIKTPLILDGGLSNQLVAQGVDLNHPLWTAIALLEQPDKVVAAHQAYLEAGADCVITSSYQVSVPGLMAYGLSAPQAIEAIKNTVTLAQQAVSNYQTATNDLHPKYVAASVGPYGAYLADGSEYFGHYDLSEADLMAFHTPRLNALIAAQPDIIACETIPCATEAKVLTRMLSGCDIPAWLSFSCKDSAHLCDGTPLASIAEELSESNWWALGINCTAPQHITPLINILKAHAPSKKIVIYPNSGQVYNAQSKEWTPCESPPEFAEQIQEWVNAGADIIGGCCQINPDHIQAIANTLRKES